MKIEYDNNEEYMEEFEPKQFNDLPLVCAIVLAVWGVCGLVYFVGCRYLIGG